VTPGSPDTFTLADISGFPNIDDIFGTSGTSPEMLFVIHQYTDSSRSELSKAQLVWGTVDLSTKILTPTVIVATWNGTTYDDTEPTELDFTAGADTTRVFQGAVADHSLNLLSKNPFDGWFGHPDGTELWAPSNNLEPFDSYLTLSANMVYYTPFLWLHAPDRLIKRAGVKVTIAASGKSIRLGLYMIDKGNDGKPGDLVADFGAIDAGSTGVKYNTSASWASPTANFRLSPGWYWSAIVSDGTPEIVAPAQLMPGPIPQNGDRQGRFFSRSMTYGAFAAKGYNNGSGSAVLWFSLECDHAAFRLRREARIAGCLARGWRDGGSSGRRLES